MLITGASGYLGARLYLDLSRSFRVVGTYKSKMLSEEFEKLDITNPESVKELMSAYKPTVIVHTAASSSPVSCMLDPANAVKINQNGTENIVNAANDIGAILIFISSASAGLGENLYESTKIIGEQIVKRTLAGHVILKPSAIFGMSPNSFSDSQFNRILKNIDGDTHIEYDTSWKFQPTWIAHISEIITCIVERGMRNMELPVVVPEMKSRFNISDDLLSGFGLRAKPIDEKSSRKSIESDTSWLQERDLPVHTYKEMISGIINEIRSKDRYSL